MADSFRRQSVCIKQSEAIKGLAEEIKDLLQQGREQDRRIQQLVGYSITQAGDVLDVQMALRDIFARLSKLEDQGNNQED